jgi:hypothetical protein
MHSFSHPKPDQNPRLQLIAKTQDNLKMSRTGGFGFICYDLTQEKTEEARFLKIRVVKTTVSQTAMEITAVSKFDFVLELPAVD